MDETTDAAPAGNPLARPEAWDLVADAYTEHLVPLWQETAREALALAQLPPEAHIVDVAAGPGTLALLAATQGATVSAIDFSPAMVANLQRRAREMGLQLADARVGDGQALPYPDNRFDGGFSMVGLVFFPDRAAGFRELWRVLKPGRRAVVSAQKEVGGAFTEIMPAIRAHLPALPQGQGTWPLSDPADFTREMSAAGFRHVTIHSAQRSNTQPSVAAYWEMIQRSAAPLALMRRQLGEARWAEIARGVQDQLQTVLGDGPVTDTWVLNLGVGVK